MKPTKTEKKIEEVKPEEVKPTKHYEISDIVTRKDTEICPEGYEEVELDEDIELLHLKAGDKVFVPTVERMKSLGRL